MVKILIKRILCAFIISSNFAYSLVCTNEIENIDWCWEQSLQQGFYFIIDIEINGIDIDPGSVPGGDEQVWECPEGDCDIIGAFYNDQCVGWTYPYSNNGYTIPVMMNDGQENTDSYPSSGDIPEFRLYDNSTNTVYSTTSNPDTPPIYPNDINIIQELFSIPLSVDEVDLPTIFNISDIYPNPFNASTKISYSIPAMSSIKVSVFNILGQEMVTLLDSEQVPGYYNVIWDAGDTASGFYIIRLENNLNTISKKVLLVK